MKIEKLHVENFGKISNFDLVFSSGLNQQIHNNGWGKSTLSAFIKAMFYGLEAKGRKKDFEAERSKFQPWQGGLFGGNIIFQVGEERYQIFRTFGKTPEEDKFQLVDLLLGKVSNKFSSNIGEELFGVGKETFSISAFFGQNDLSSSTTDEVVANLAGIEKYKNDGEKTESALKLLEKNRKEIVANQPKEAELKQLESYIEKLEQDINQSKETIRVIMQESQPKVEEKQAFDKFFDDYKEKERDNRRIIEKRNQLQQNLNSKNLQLSELLQKPVDKSKNFYYIFSTLFIFIGLLFVVLFACNVLSIAIALGIGLPSVAIGTGLLIIRLCRKESKNLNEIEGLKKEIESIRQVLLELPKANEDKDEELYQKKLQLEQQVAVYNAQIANLTSGIEASQEELTLALTKYNKDKEEKEEGLKKIEILKMTMDFLKTARENVSERFVTPLNEKFNSIFEKFSNAEQISIDSGLNPWVMTSQGLKHIEYLSQGYQDLVVICQRFSLLDKIYKKEKPCVILDDSFVNLDDKNFALAKEVIKLLSKDYQVIYFSCSNARAV